MKQELITPQSWLRVANGMIIRIIILPITIVLQNATYTDLKHFPPVLACLGVILVKMRTSGPAIVVPTLPLQLIANGSVITLQAYKKALAVSITVIPSAASAMEESPNPLTCR